VDVWTVSKGNASNFSKTNDETADQALACRQWPSPKSDKKGGF